MLGGDFYRLPMLVSLSYNRFQGSMENYDAIALFGPSVGLVLSLHLP